MEIIGHYIPSMTPRQFYTIQMRIEGRGRITSWLTDEEFKKEEDAVRTLIEWLDQCDEKETNADGRVMKVKVYPDGSVRFWEREWHCSIAFQRFSSWPEDMIERNRVLRRMRMQEVRGAVLT